MKYIFLISLFGGFSFEIYSQSLKSNIELIEAQRNKCEAKAYYDKDFEKCYCEATIAMDKELNNVYKKIINLLKKEDVTEFKNNQKKWLNFYDSEIKFNKSIFKSQLRGGVYEFGTLVDVETSSVTYKILKERVETFARYYTVLNTGL